MTVYVTALFVLVIFVRYFTFKKIPERYTYKLYTDDYGNVSDWVIDHTE